MYVSKYTIGHFSMSYEVDLTLRILKIDIFKSRPWLFRIPWGKHGSKLNFEGS